MDNLSTLVNGGAQMTVEHLESRSAGEGTEGESEDSKFAKRKRIKILGHRAGKAAGKGGGVCQEIDWRWSRAIA